MDNMGVGCLPLLVGFLVICGFFMDKPEHKRRQAGPTKEWTELSTQIRSRPKPPVQKQTDEEIEAKMQAIWK